MYKHIEARTGIVDIMLVLAGISSGTVLILLLRLIMQISLFVFISVLSIVTSHGPPMERDNEDIAMGRKMGGKWCSMAKVCNHDRVPVCGANHAGDLMGFRDLCDMFDFNCIRRRNYKQTSCPEDKSILSASRKPTNYYED